MTTKCYVILFINSDYDDKSVIPLKAFSDLAKAKRYLKSLFKAATKDKTYHPLKTCSNPMLHYHKHKLLSIRHPSRYPETPCPQYGVTYQLETIPFLDS